MKKFIPWILSVVLMTIILTLTVSVDLPVGNPGRSATFYVGSILTPWPAYATVDYQCDGVDDHIQIQQALDALPVNGGKIVIYAGNYHLGATVSRAIGNIVIEGVGSGTYLANNGVTNIFNVGVQTRWIFKDIRVDTGGISIATATEWSFDNVWIGAGYVAKRSAFTTTQSQDMANKLYVDGAIAGVPVSIGNITGSGTAGIIVKWVNSTSIGDASNTDAQVAATILASHTQGTDTALGVLGTKNPPIDADKVVYRDSTSFDSLVTSTWLQFKASLKSYFDTQYAALGSVGGGGNITGSGSLDSLSKWTNSTNLVSSSVKDVDVSDAVTKKHTQGTDTTLGPLIAAINMNGNLITNGATPVAASDMATKGYVDSVVLSTSSSYGDEIAQGLVSNTTSWSKIGYNDDIGLGVEDMWILSNQYRFLTGASKLQVISTNAADTAVGTGAQNVTITYLDTNYVEKSETITLNGTTAVNTTNTDYFRVQNFRTWGVGSFGCPVGSIDVRNASNTTQILGRISSGENSMRTLIWTVPVGKTLYITTVTCTSASGSKQSTVRLTTRATYDNQNGRLLVPGLQFVGYTEMYLQDDALVLPLNPPTRLPEKTDIRVGAIADVAGAKATVSLRGYVTVP